MPSWDNTSRRGKAGNVFFNASPEVFEAWLSVLCAQTQRDNPSGKRFVFVNAWNEWSEGAYLEPDRKNGHRNLKAVRSALSTRNMLLGTALLPESSVNQAVFQRQAREMIATLVRANQQILRFISDHSHWQQGGSSPFIKRPSSAIRVVRYAETGTSNIETVNGRHNQNSQITMLRGQKVHLKGWCRIPGVWLSESLPIFFHLLEGSQGAQGSEYIAAVNERQERQDVANVFEDSQGQWYGFVSLLDVQAVHPGSYDLAILIGIPNEVHSVYRLLTNFVVHVG